MPINYEIKSQLAKLLATEDLVVENRNVRTAQFNVDTRVLTLPMWKRASNSVYDMLVGHEVGHALFTPNVDPPKSVPHQFLNVTEDARIEKLMKRKYPGLHKSFFAGYKELSEDDFFCLDGEDLETMNLADRINLYYKIGRFVDIPFTDDEKDIVDMVGESETFGDACIAAETLYKYCKGQQTQQEKMPDVQMNSDGVGGGTPEKDNTPSSQSESQESEEGESEENSVEESGEVSEDVEDINENESYGGTSNMDVTTDDMFNQGVEQLNGNFNPYSVPGYYEVPDANIEEIVVPYHQIKSELDLYFTCEERIQDANFDWADDEYKKFKKNAQREVNYLVKEFECKKSADAYARAATSRTGVLDCTKLHTYKYNEDLFKKVTTIPDGKNHGLIFILDWSGSMADVLKDTIKQLYNLVWFCSKTNIPFDVYAFTSSYAVREHEGFQDLKVPANEFWIAPDFNMLNVLSSKFKKKDLEAQMINLWRVVYQFKHYCGWACPPGYGLSGTPLNEALYCLHNLIPQFKKENNLQKVQCVILSDGEANPTGITRKYWNDYLDKECVGTSRLSPETSYLRNRKTGHTYKIGYEYYKFTEIVLNDLKQTFPNTNFIGFRIAEPRDFGSFIKRYESINDAKYRLIKKAKFHAIKNSGYTSYFAILSNALNNDTEFDVEEGASKAKIKSAFTKNLKGKALNKKVLSQFMDLVC